MLNFLKGKIQFFSEKGQDKWVIEEVFKRKKNGFFLDLAASDGIGGNNTYVLEKNFKWKGICVEANDDFYEKLIKNRDCICDSSCIDSRNGTVEFIKNGALGGIIDSDTDNNFTYRDQLIKNLNDRIIRKDTITLSQLLNKYNSPNIIDFFSFDVEGAETRILKDFPFQRYIFLSMVIERPTPILNKILFDNGYVFVRKSRMVNNFDSFYVHKSIKNFYSIKKEAFQETPQKDW